MPYHKGNIVKNGGTSEECCGTCCEFDRFKKTKGGYCVHEGAVEEYDFCPLYLQGAWLDRLKLRQCRKKQSNKILIQERTERND